MRTQPAGVRVTLNGADASALIGVDTPVDLGRYTVTVSAASRAAWQKTVEVAAEGQLVTVIIARPASP